jgi:MFS family permease
VAAAAAPAAWFAQLVGIPAVLVGHGWEPWQVGTLLLPSAAVALFVPRHVGPLLERFGAARCLALSGLVAAASLMLAAVGTAVPAAWALVPGVILATVSFGIGQPALMASVGDAVTHDVRGVALGVATLLFLVGGSIGSAAVAGLGDLVGVPGSLGILAVFPLVGIAVLAPVLRKVPVVSASR